MQPCLREWLYGVFVRIFVRRCSQFFCGRKNLHKFQQMAGCSVSLPVPSSSWTSPMPCLRSDVCCASATLRSLKTPWAMSSRKHSRRSKSPSSCDRSVRSQWDWADMCTTTPQQHRAPQQDLQEGERAKQFTPFFLFRVFKKHISQLLSINVHANCGCKKQINNHVWFATKMNPPPPQNNSFDS